MTSSYNILGEKLGFFHDKLAELGFFNPLDATLHCPVGDRLSRLPRQGLVCGRHSAVPDRPGRQKIFPRRLSARRQGHLRAASSTSNCGSSPGRRPYFDEDRRDGIRRRFRARRAHDPSLQFNVDYDDERGQAARGVSLRRCELAYKASVTSIRAERPAIRKGIVRLK